MVEAGVRYKSVGLQQPKSARRQLYLSETPNSKMAAKTSNNPKTYDMALEALSNSTDRRGASLQSIRQYIIKKYEVEPNMLRSRLRKALEKGLEAGVIIRPKSSEDAGTSMTKRFKLDKAKYVALSKPKKAPAKARARSTSKSPKAKSKTAARKSSKSPARPSKKSPAKTKKSPSEKPKKKKTVAKKSSSKSPVKKKKDSGAKASSKSKAKSSSKSPKAKTAKKKT